MKKINIKWSVAIIAIVFFIIGFIGYLLPSAVILLTPVTITFIVALLLFLTKDVNLITRSLLCYFFIAMNDIGIKLLLPGKFDMRGMGWIHMMLFIGLVPCIAMLAIASVKDRQSKFQIKAISILSFILLIYIHLTLFDKLGVEY